MSQELTFTKEFESSKQDVYDALTKSPRIGTWLGNYGSIQAQENGRFYAWWSNGYATTGVVSKAEENEVLEFTWNGSGEPGETKVSIQVSGNGTGAKLTLTHSGLGEGEAWAATAEQIKAGWEDSLDNLLWVVDKGLDRRPFQRPFFGITGVNPITEDQAKELGIDSGVTLNLYTGGSLDVAGFTQEDVILTIGGHKIETFQSLVPIADEFKAGDEVDVELYRDGEKTTMQMTFQSRPMPEVPTTAQGFADELRKIYAELDKELDEVFAGVSEDEANHRPTPEEWSAKEVVAHLLMTERWFHAFISTEVNSTRGPSYSNYLPAIEGLAKAYPTTADIIQTLKFAEQAIVNAIELLPDDIVARKITITNLANWPLLFLANHSRGHFTQMQAAIEAARAA